MLSPQFVLRFVISDLQRNVSRFLFVMLAFAVGVGIFVAVSTLQNNIKQSLDVEAKALLAADLLVSSSEPLSSEVLQVFPRDSHAAQELTFASMLSPGAASHTERVGRLVQVRAIAGSFPVYGEAVVTPPEALEILQTGADSPGALLDRTLIQQLELKIGDAIQIGSLPLKVAGIVEQFPGESYARTVIAPKVFVPLAAVMGSELLQRGSRLTYKQYLAIPHSEELSTTIQRLKTLQPNYRFEIETVETRKRSVGRVLDNVGRFLMLISFAAVLLGGIGVGSAMQTYIQNRLPLIASLRCMGATQDQVTTLYILQGLFVASLGGVVGVLIGAGTLFALPAFFAEFIPIQFTPQVLATSLAQGLLVAISVGTFFCLWPLLKAFRVPPAQALRSVVEQPATNQSARERRLLLAIGVLGFWVIAQFMFGSVSFATYACAGLLGVWGLLLLLSWCVGTLLQASHSLWSKFTVRYAFSALVRPQNQTGMIISTLGFAAFLIGTIAVARSTIIDQVSVAGSGDRPNLVLFDVQLDQVTPVRQLLEQHNVTVQQQVPIVTMRLVSINGKDNFALRADPEIPEWTLRREYRSTYRDVLIESESMIAGSSTAYFEWNGDAAQVVPVTIEEGIARDLKAKIGDTVSFDVQGVPITTKITGIRRVDWRRVQTNFFFLFPKGVLEDAPQFYALMGRAGSSEALAAAQRDLSKQFGNVSAIDLNLILETADVILSKVAVAIEFLALFTMIAGLLVLTGALATTRTTRLRELLLLKTIGATRAQIVRMTVVEFLLLGVLSASVGVGASLLTGGIIAAYYFQATLVAPYIELSIIIAALIFAVLGAGVAVSVRLFRVPPIEILRVS